MAAVIWLWVGILGGILGSIGAVQMWRRGRKMLAATFGAYFLLALLGVAAELWALGKIAERAIIMAMVVMAFATLIILRKDANERARSSLQ